MVNYVVGLDGGGTKTAVLVSDIKGNLLHTFHSGAINYNGESNENVESNLADIFAEITAQIGGLVHCGAICIGAAGVSNKAAEKALTQAVWNTGYLGPLIIAGDHEIALYGALGKPDGIILIAGTGSICYGKNASGETYRTGGFGYLIDDEGSGYAIGRDILAAVVRANDGRMGETVLTEMVFHSLSLSSIQEVIGFVYSKETNKRDIAAISPQLMLACAQQDLAALNIADKCSTELTKLVTPVAEKLGLGRGELALAGSILEKNEIIRSSFERKIKIAYPEITCVQPKNSAAYGAVMMALEILRKSHD